MNGLILLLSFYLVIVFLLLVIIQVHGFSMTPELKKETKLLKYCIMYQINSTNCDEIYGAIPEQSKGIPDKDYRKH